MDDFDLQCSICLDFYFEPLTLQCRHSFCRVCLLQSTKLAPDGRSCPQCRAPIESITDPLKHPADADLEAKVAAAVPAERLEERREESKTALEALAEQSAAALPVFVMRGGQDARPGAPVNLHFFEPRYRVLIRRAWEGERRFLWADRAPSPPQALRALLISVEDARFLPDGRANVIGRVVERVTVDHSWIEQGTGGLWYAGAAPPAAGAAVPSVPATPATASVVPTSPRRSSASAATVEQLLMLAISRGAPAYNRGDVRGCAELYVATARRILSETEGPRGNGSRVLLLREALLRAEPLLEPSAADGPRGARRKADAAAWLMRHAFDTILDARGGSPPRAAPQPQPASARASAERPSSSDELERELERELPVFHFPGLSVGVGARATFALFEPRYLLMAEECMARPLRQRLLLCASVPRGGGPVGGQPATLARLEACAVEGQRLRATLVGVRSGRLGDVRQDAEKAGLWYGYYGALDAQAPRARRAESGRVADEPRSGSRTRRGRGESCILS